MSMLLTQPLHRALSIAAAALFIQIGSAAAASPQVDFQQQVKAVLAGSIAAHAIPHAEADPANTVRSHSNMQQFLQQLLLGWSVSHVGRTRASKQNLQAEMSDASLKPHAHENFQLTVRQSLIGVSVSSRGAW